MEWAGTLVASMVVLLLVGPVVVLVGSVMLMWLGSQLVPPGATVSRASFDCAFSRRRVSAEFLTEPGADHPGDVTACSAFADGHPRCQKGCLELAGTATVASPLTPRFALIADGVAYRGAV
jgi:hypothetical protein